MNTNIVFTRYLYLKSGVLESLEASILKNDFQESLFWAYEIYFSGFEEEIFEYIFVIIERFYTNHPKLMNFLKKKRKEWEKDKKDEILGIIIKNLSLKNHLSKEGTGRQIYITIKPTDIDDLRNKEIKPVYKTLKTVCTYNGLKKQLKAMNTFRERWLFYACYSPIWKTRVLEYNGIIDSEKKTVVFSNDDDSDNFYDDYGYEPDEQSLEIQRRCMFSL